MNAELRIGNQVLINGEPDTIRGGGIAAIESGYLKDVKPIPLTEERFKEYGAEKRKFGEVIKFNSLCFETEINNLRFVWKAGKVYPMFNDYLIGMPCCYVHSLQNSYFAFTGKELPIK